MRRQKQPEWERKLRGVATHLTSSAQEIFGPVEAVSFATPDEAPERVGGPSDEHPHTSMRPAGKANRLSPRERRGRD